MHGSNSVKLIVIMVRTSLMAARQLVSFPEPQLSGLGIELLWKVHQTAVKIFLGTKFAGNNFGMFAFDHKQNQKIVTYR